MELDLFSKINESAELLEENYEKYQTIEYQIINYFDKLYMDSEYYIGYYSRIKSVSSFKNKIINNKYYLKYETSKDIIDNMVDIIGITIECRFKNDEKKIFKHLFKDFEETNGFYQSKTDRRIHLKLNDQQPKQEKNGFYNYRIDGFFLDDNDKVNFELQIRSLVNTFWSGVEHQVIYKNNNYVLNDRFMTEMLLSVRDSLDALDFQLNNIYEQMVESDQESFGLYQQSMKSFLAKAIHDLYINKLQESTALELDIKQSSAILSHYIYIVDFLRSDHPDQTMLNYLEHMNYLLNEELDFKSVIQLGTINKTDDVFVDRLTEYFVERMNKDYDWHVLFVMLFSLREEESNESTLVDFATFIKELLINPTWYNNIINNYNLHHEKNHIEESIVNQLIKIDNIKIIHENFLYEVMLLFRKSISEIIYKIENEEEIDVELEMELLNRNIDRIYIQIEEESSEL